MTYLAAVTAPALVGTAAAVTYNLTKPTGHLRECIKALRALKKAGTPENYDEATAKCDPDGPDARRLSRHQRKRLGDAYDRVVDPYRYIPWDVLPNPDDYETRGRPKACAAMLRGIKEQDNNDGREGVLLKA